MNAFAHEECLCHDPQGKVTGTFYQPNGRSAHDPNRALKMDCTSNGLGQRSARPTLLHSIINAKVMQSIEEVQIDREEDYNESSYEMSSALIT